MCVCICNMCMCVCVFVCVICVCACVFICVCVFVCVICGGGRGRISHHISDKVDTLTFPHIPHRRGHKLTKPSMEITGI